MNKKIRVINILIILFFSFTGFLCDDRAGGSGNGGPGGNCEVPKYFTIYSLNNSGNEYKISFAGCFNSNTTLNVHIKILGDYGGGCIAYTNDNFATIQSGVQTIENSFYSNNFVSTCNSNNRWYTIYAYVNDGDTTRECEPQILPVGYPPAISSSAKIEYDYYTGYNFWNIDSTKKTFKDPTTNTPLNIEMKSNPSVIESQEIFEATDDETLLNQIVSYMSSYRSSDTINFPIYLNMSHSAKIGNLYNTLGISYTRLNSGSKRNLSFVFCDNIKKIHNTTLYSQPGYRNSVNSFVICHELLHQIGIAYYNNAHHDHTDTLGCALQIGSEYPKYVDHYLAGEMVWRVCNKHITFIKNSPFLTNHSHDNLVSGGENYDFPHRNNNTKQDSLKSSLNISLSKYSYKQYEPILTLIKFINNKNLPDTIVRMFNEYEDDLNFNIIPLDGQYYNRRVKSFSILFAPNPYIVQSKDTFLFSRNLNNFGNDMEGSNYFGMAGYLSPGRYKLLAKGRNKNNSYVSDTLEFEVLELNNEDNLILKMLNEKKYSEILDTYPNSPFYEAVSSFYATKSFKTKLVRNYYLKDDIMNLYKSFFNRFPNSYYCYNPSFIGFMFSKLTASTNDIISEIQELKDEYYGFALCKFLEQRDIVKDIIKSDEYMRSDIEENEKHPGKMEIFENDK